MTPVAVFWASVLCRGDTQSEWSGFRPDSTEPKLAYSFGLQERTSLYMFPQPQFRPNERTIETFHGNNPEGEYRPSNYKDSVPRFLAAQDEDGEAFGQSSLVVFASPTFAKHAAIHQCSRQALPFTSPPPISFVNKTSLALQSTVPGLEIERCVR